MYFSKFVLKLDESTIKMKNFNYVYMFFFLEYFFVYSIVLNVQVQIFCALHIYF